MDPLRLDRFVEIVNGELIGAKPDPDTIVQHVATHSGRIRSAAAFFALRGSRTDGHNFVEAAARNGAAVAVVEAGRGQPAAGTIPLVAVEDPLQSLQDLAAWWRRSLDTRFVAVAGSNGKTTTKDCLVHLLGFKRHVYGTPGSYNSQLGVPLAVLECPRSAEVAVIEVAVSDPGEMARLAKIVDPDYVVLTNVGTRWRYRFDSRDQQIRELLSIALAVPEDGWLVLGQDDPDLRVAAADLSCRYFIPGISSQLPTFGKPTHDPGTARSAVTFPDGRVAPIAVRTPSDEILADVELAMSAAWLLGVDADLMLAALEEYIPTSTRMEIWKSPNGVTLVRDVATPDPMVVSSGVRTAKRLVGQGGRTVVVLAEPAASWDEHAAVGLAQTLMAEGVDDLFGFAMPFHQRTASLIREADDSPTVRLFDSLADLRRALTEQLESGDVCLVQSPAWRPIGDLTSSLIEVMAPTRLYLDLSAIENNVTTFRRLVGPSVSIMAMVKALAYGTDAINVSLALQESGVDFLGVSSADEGIALRRAGINLPILTMLGTGGEIDKMLRYGLTPLIYSPEMLQAVASLPRDPSHPIGVHLEVDSGMHRAGLDPEGAKHALGRLVHLEGIRLEGLMTHLACADDPEQDAFTAEQLARFDDVVRFAESLGLNVKKHAAATAAAIRIPSARYDMIRLGAGLFGFHLSEATAKELDLEPAIGLVSRIVHIMDVPAGERVGYGGTYISPEGGGRIGLVPAGYHDCVPRAFSNFGYVMVAGVRCRIVGRVSMDSMTVDLSECPDAAVGSDVLIYGRQGDWLVPLEEVSAVIGSIPHEVMARVGPRVQRIFTRH